MKYKRKASRRHETKATNIRNRISIHQRPVEADGRRFGDWEMDLIVGQGQQRHPDADGKEHELPAHGETQTGKEGRAGGESRVEAASTLQRGGLEVHNHGQRQRVCGA